MGKNELTPEESFQIINKAISNIKISYKEYAGIFLLWGWILALASFSNFIILKVLHNREVYGQMGFYSLGNWLVFAIIGFVFMYLMGRKINKEKKVYSHLERNIKSVWWVALASFAIATVLCIKLEINPPPIMLLIAGFATTTSGLLIKYRPVIIGGMAFFLFSIASTFVANAYIALIVCAAIICGYLIPGYFLRSAKE
jgi:hypothetical protein